ncbi:MAG TPA: SH3 domain-containing protein [Candidatus Limnocylindrales bacterium]|nr:SH3 domain-containing protein [Candidatus Limnocylindrales bacterium]
MTTPPRTEPPVRPEDTNPSGATRMIAPPPPEKPKRRSSSARSGRSSSPLYLPLWSVAVMLLFAFCGTFTIISAALLLGGNRAPGGEPRVVIITAAPSPTFDAQGQPLPTATSALLPSGGNSGAIPTFALEGPTLPPVILSPTPISIAVGQTVTVNEDQVRLRGSAGLDGELISYLALGTRFTIIGGPQQASGLTWWQVEDPTQPVVRGWVAGDYLDPVTETSPQT